MTLRKERILENERGSTRSHSVENWCGRGCGPDVKSDKGVDDITP
jgi:hypothetical protein